MTEPEPDSETTETSPCEGLPLGGSCDNGMVFLGYVDTQFCDGTCTYLGACTDPRHSEKESNAEA